MLKILPLDSNSIVNKPKESTNKTDATVLLWKIREKSYFYEVIDNETVLANIDESVSAVWYLATSYDQDNQLISFVPVDRYWLSQSQATIEVTKQRNFNR